MIVSDSEKFVFIHNPKCGGMSCHNTLRQYDTRNNFFFEWRPVDKGGKILDLAHITPFQMRKFFPKAFGEVNGYLKFVFVRNPYDRFLSAVSQHLKLGTTYMREAVLSSPDTFYDVAGRFALTTLRKHSVENDHKLVHFRQQCSFVNIDGRPWADLVLRLERPEVLASTPVSVWLPNMAHKANSTSAFSSNGYEAQRMGVEAIRAINEFYARDFDAFEYDLI